MKKNRMKLLPSWIAVAIGLSFLAFTSPQAGDLVELSTWLSGRSSGFFRAIDGNRIKDLAPGTRGTIKKVKLFSKTQNYGICLNLPQESSDCIWVYYNKNHPNMQLIREKSKDTPQPVLTQDPKQAQVAQTIIDVQGIEDKPIVEAKGVEDLNIAPLVAADDTSDDTAAKTALENIALLNKNAAEALTVPVPDCAECSVKMSSYPTCTKNNSYQESAVADILQSSKYAGIFQGKQPELIKTSCIQRALETSSAGGGLYRHCDSSDVYAGQIVPRACTSENYVQLVSKSFNIVANCLSGMVSGSETTKSETSLILFSLMSLESGMNLNAVSPTQAGGPGQLTGAALGAVNQYLPNIKSYLAKSDNPQCSDILLKALEQPMSNSLAKSCDRISLFKDNPLKNFIYTFGYQFINRKFIDDAFDGKIYSDVIDAELPALEKERLLSSLAVWSHNTGIGGMQVPLRIILTSYLQRGMKISNAKDVTQFLKQLAPIMQKYPHRANSTNRRRNETSNFFSKINNRVSTITSEPTSCLAQ